MRLSSRHQRVQRRIARSSTSKRSVWERNRLSLAISAAVAATAGGVTNAAELEEILVTATKRSATAQEVPLSVQAVTGDTLREYRVETFDKYVEYLPNVINTGNGPGKKELYIRGSATEQTSVTISAAQGSAPGVALYLDEQPVSFGGRNLDVYAADIERVELLSGPQGTLFGASSQSGNLRLITNKPRTDAFEAGFNAKYGNTHGGDDSASADAYVNIPLSDRLALRAVVYSDNQGGWVDNVPATFTPSAAVIDRNNAGYGPAVADADSVASTDNFHIAKNDWNEAAYRGGRVGVAFDINEDWDLLLQHSAQTLKVDGSFLVSPELDSDDDSARFAPETNKDEFGLTTWTLNGRLANLDVVYTGGYLSRDVDSVIDYTHYNNGGGYIAYYLCSGNLYDHTDPNNCFDPTKQFTEDTKNERMTHELRFTTTISERLHLLGGIYYNDVETNHIGDFQYASANDAFAEHINSYYNNNSGDGFLLGNESLPTPGVNAQGPRTPFTVFFNDFTRTEEEWAFFGEVAFDVTDQVSASLSARYYDLTSQLQGASNFSFGCRYGIGGNAQRTADGRCSGTDFSNDVTKRLQLLGQYNEGGDDSVILDAMSPLGNRNLWRGGGGNQGNEPTLGLIKAGRIDLGGLQSDGSLAEDDIILRATLDWKATEDLLLFVNYAEGYRPATQNRNAGQMAVIQSGVYQDYAVPAAARTDELTSYEVGMKSYWLDRSLRLNATFFFSEIQNLQVSRFDPSNVAFLFFIENVGDAESLGLDADFQWSVSDALTISGAFSILDTELTSLSDQLQGIAVPVGSELPFAAGFAGHLRGRYEFPVAALDGRGYVTASVHYRGESVTGIIGSAEFMEDTLRHVTGNGSGLEIEYYDDTFGTVGLDGSTDNARGAAVLPRSSRYVNSSSTTLHMSAGLEKDSWAAEVFVDNLNNEDAAVAQVAGFFTPHMTVQRPRTVGVRVSYDFE